MDWWIRLKRAAHACVNMPRILIPGHICSKVSHVHLSTYNDHILSCQAVHGYLQLLVDSLRILLSWLHPAAAGMPARVFGSHLGNGLQHAYATYMCMHVYCLVTNTISSLNEVYRNSTYVRTTCLCMDPSVTGRFLNLQWWRSVHQ